MDILAKFYTLMPLADLYAHSLYNACNEEVAIYIRIFNSSPQKSLYDTKPVY